MRNVILSWFLTSLLIACDPSESLDAVINNNTDLSLRISFVSSQILTEMPNQTEFILVASRGKTSYARLGSDSGIGNVAFSLQVFDSIYITDMSDEILQVYKPNTQGKNIFNIDEYWEVTEPSKNHFVYSYTINDEDLGN
ncbi:hypothetical protein M3P19_08490 [Muricauda sp. 2012CJ35-5]|uniref:Uncharacterized protein n=1 Tax=Flagellimonas spongiicola TaxID=2942208 RepID=A0ABT0PRQ6_9FLAO|nr:hypothetical protein [Allomuricauda spongiicola]MCL6274045.1 hypothetical protein [Allomuricauda spongiicola]